MLDTHREKLRGKWPGAVCNSVMCENQTGIWEVAPALFQTPTVVKIVIWFLQRTGPNSSSEVKKTTAPEVTDVLSIFTSLVIF